MMDNAALTFRLRQLEDRVLALENAAVEGDRPSSSALDRALDAIEQSGQPGIPNQSSNAGNLT